MTTKTKKKKAASLDGMVPENECVKNCAACTFDECNGHGAYPRRAPQNGAGAQAAPPTDQAAAAFELIALNLIRPTKDNPRRSNMADS